MPLLKFTEYWPVFKIFKNILLHYTPLLAQPKNYFYFSGINKINMRKLVSIPVLMLALLVSIIASAQTKSSKTPKKQTASEVALPSPPMMETEEATKIDVAPVAAFDSSLAPNDELTREIKRMLKLSDAVNMGLSTAESIIKQQKQGNENEELEAFYKAFLKEIKSPRVYTLFENIFVKIYRKHFTLEEAKELSKFYSTPLGKKTIQLTPLTMQESQAECGKLGQMLAMEIYQQMEDK